MQTKQIDVQIEKAASPDYDAAFIMSSTAIDRDKDTFTAESLEAVAKSTKKLIALWQHSPEHPVGYWSDISFDGKRLKGYIKFATTRLAEMVKQLINDGVPLAASVGFRATKSSPNDHGGQKFEAVDLFETSIVSTPANAQAIQVAKSLGLSETDLFPSVQEKDSTGDSAIHPSVLSAKRAIIAVNRITRN